MADQLSPMKFAILGDVSQALGELQRFNAALLASQTNLTTQTSKLEALLVKQTAAFTNALGKAVPASANIAAKSITAMSQQISTALNGVGVNMRRLESQTLDLQRAVLTQQVAFSKALAVDTPSAAATAAVSVESLGTRVSKSIGAIGTQLTSLRFISSGVGVAIGGVFAGRALQSFAEFDKAITAVRAVSKDTEEQFKATRSEVLKLATDLQVGAREIALGLNDIVQAGFKGAEAFNILETSVKGARAGLTTTSVSSNALIATLNAFKIPAGQSADVMGKLIKAVDLGIFTFDRLAENIGQVAPQAALAGASLEELLGLMTTLTRQELNLDEVTTQLKAAFAQLINPSAQIRSKMEDVLGTTVEASIATKGLYQTLNLLIASTGGSATALAELFPGVREMSAVAKAAAAGISELNGDMQTLSATGASTLNQTLAIQRESVASLIEQITALLGLGYTKFFEDTRGTVVDAGKAIRDFLKDNQELVIALTGVTVAGGAMLGVLGLIAGSAVAAGFAMRGFSLTLLGVEKVGSVLVGGAGIFNSIAGFFKGAIASDIERVTKSFARLKAVMAVDALARTRGILLNVGEATKDMVGAMNPTVLQRFKTGLVALLPTLGNLKGLFTGGAGAMALLTGALGTVKVAFVSVAAAIGGVASSLAAILIPIAAVVATAVGFYKLGEAIGDWAFRTTEAKKAVLKQAEEYERIAAGQVERDKARAAEQTDVELTKTQKIADAYKRLAEVSSKAEIGDTSAIKEMRTIGAELKKLGEANPLEKLKLDFDELRTKLQQFREAQVRAGEAPAEARTAFEKIFGDPKKGDEAFFRFTELQKAVRGYGYALTESASNAVAFEEANQRLAGALDLARANFKRVADEVEGIAEERRRSSLTPFERQVEDLTAEITTLQNSRDKIARTLEQLDRAGGTNTSEARDLLGLLNTIDNAIGQSMDAREKMYRDDADKRVKAMEDAAQKLEDLEIEILDKQGKRQEAEEARALRAFNNRLKEIEALKDVDEKVKDDLKRAAKELYDAELDDINRNAAKRAEQDKEQEKRDRERAAREHKDALESEANLLREKILLEEANGITRESLSLRERLLGVEKEIAANKERDLQSELELLDKTRKRVALLEQERDTARRVGADGADVARRAQQDVLGASDPVSLRGALRDRLSGVNNVGTVREIGKAGETALRAEAEELFRQREEALRRGDKEEVKRIDQQLNSIREKYRVLVEEVRKREAELLELERQRFAEQKRLYEQQVDDLRKAKGLDKVQNRETVERNLKKAGKIGEDDVVIGRDKNGKIVTAPRDEVVNGGAATPAQPAPANQPGQPAAPGQPGKPGAPGVVRDNSDPSKPLNDATSALKDASNSLSVALNAAYTVTASAMTTVADKMTQMAGVVNQHSAFISNLQQNIQRINIEGAR